MDGETGRLRCPVRGCGIALGPAPGGLACVRGHRFDRAREGYVNLLLANQRRSAEPGDAASTVAARVRLAEAGLDGALREAVAEEVGALDLSERAALLEVGCGVGTQLARLAGATAAERHGLDLSRAAVRAAARRAPGAVLVVANADRELPYLDGSFELVLSVKARLAPAEFARVLVPGGALLLAVPAPDDLAELRSVSAGAPLARDPAERALAETADRFVPLRRRAVRERAALPHQALVDLLASGYRGARASERARLESLEHLEVTLSSTLLLLRRRT